MNLKSVLRLMGLSGLARFAILPLTALATAVSTSMIVGYAGADAFGYIALVGLLFQLVPFADLGLGAPIVNVVSQRSSDAAAEALAVSTVRAAFRILVISALGVVILAAAISFCGSWSALLGLPDDFLQTANWALFVVLLPFAISLPLGVGQRILLGNGKNHYVNFVSAIGPVVALGATAALIWAGVEPLFLAIATPLGVSVVSLTCFAIAFKVSGWSWTTVLFSRTRPVKVPLWGAAIPMLIISVTVPLAMQSHRLVLSHISSAGELAQYSIAAQFYIPAYGLLATAVVTLWPVFARMGSDAQPLWTRVLALMAGIGAVGAVGFILLIRPIGVIVTGDEIHVSPGLAASFGCLLFVMAIHQPSAVLLTTPRLLRFQAACSFIMVAISIPLSVVLAGMLGAPGPVIATTLGVFVGQVVPGIVRSLSYFREQRMNEEEVTHV